MAAKGNLFIQPLFWNLSLTLQKSDQDHQSTVPTPSPPAPEEKVPHLPEHIPYLIIGGGTAGFSACRTIRSSDPTAKVLILSNESREPYMKPPLSKELWFASPDDAKNFTFREWNGRVRDIQFEKHEFFIPLEKLLEREHGGVSFAGNAEILRIDVEKQEAHLKTGQVIKYDKCLIATGGEPKHLKVFDDAPEEIKDKIIYYKRAGDFERLFNSFSSVKRIAIVGGGFLGSELAFSLAKRASIADKDIQVIHIFPEKGVLAHSLPDYLSNWTTEKIKAEGVQILNENKINKVTSQSGQVSLDLSSGEKVNADIVVVSTGLDVNTEIAKRSRLEIDPHQGGILVNSELQARSNLWVAGDAACYYDAKLGRRRVEHHDHANVSGRIAGLNMAGAKKEYKHQPMFWSDIGPDVAFEAVGLIDSSLETVAIFRQDDSEEQSKEPKLGVVFYLKDKKVVGVLLWNLFGRLSVARRVVNDGRSYPDLSELAKHFSIYSTE